MALETVLMNETKNPFDLSRVVDVFWEDVLVKRTARRTVDEHKRFAAMGTGELCQKVPAISGAFDLGVFQLLPRPENGFFGAGTKTIRVKQGSVVVVAKQRH